MSVASLMITIFFSISLPALAATANPACPIDLSYVETIPWDKSRCQNNHSDCCQTLLSLFGIGLARHLKNTLMFQLPNQVAASACRIELQTRLQTMSLQPSLVPTCFNDSNQFITSASKCAGIVTVQDWEQKLGSTTELDESCRRGLSDTSAACYSCLAAGMKVTSQLVSLGRNASNNCFYFTVLYAAGIANELGPENVETASCTLGLPLTTKPFSLGSSGSPWPRYALRFRSLLSLLLLLPNIAALFSVLICFCPFSLGLSGSPWLRYALHFRSLLTSFTSTKFSASVFCFDLFLSFNFV